MTTKIQRMRAGLLAALIALLMLCSALPASADPGDGTDPSNLTWETSVTWESGITWESNVTWESTEASLSAGITWE